MQLNDLLRLYFVVHQLRPPKADVPSSRPCLRLAGYLASESSFPCCNKLFMVKPIVRKNTKTKNMKSTIFFVFALLFFVAFACNGGENQSAYISDMEMEETASFDFSAREAKSTLTLTQGNGEENQDVSSEDESVERKIIKTVNYRIQVNDVNASSEKVEQLVETHGGYISGKNLNNSSYEISNEITIRVPQDKLETLLDAIGEEAIYTNYRSERANDVTEEFVDLEIRLNTKKEVRDRYIDILRDKAQTVEDVLNAEEKIRVIQEEIESVEGRLKYLSNQVSLSTVNLTIYQRVEYQAQPDTYHESFGSRIVKSMKGGWELLQGLVLFFITIWPLIILFGVFFWQRKRIFGWLKRKEKE